MIPLNLKIFACIVIAFYFILVLNAVHKDKMPIKSSVLWLSIGILMMIFVFIPETLIKISKLAGIETISNLLFFGGMICLLVLSFDLYRINNIEKRKNITLAQEVGILKNEIHKKK